MGWFVDCLWDDVFSCLGQDVSNFCCDVVDVLGGWGCLCDIYGAEFGPDA